MTYGICRTCIPLIIHDHCTIEPLGKILYIYLRILTESLVTSVDDLADGESDEDEGDDDGDGVGG